MGVTRIGEIPVSLELGRWSIESIEASLKKINADHASIPSRVNAWVNRFLGTPFTYESSLPETQDDVVRVRLASFDCVTFVYNVLAIAGADNFSEYVKRLRNIRYKDAAKTGEVSNDPERGNFLDYACEALLFNCIDLGILKDITDQVCSDADLVHYDMTLKPVNRPEKHDGKSQRVIPRYWDRNIRTHALPSGRIESVAPQSVRNGDLVIFTHGPSRNGNEQAFFVCHCGFIRRHKKEIFFIHSTKNYYVRSNNVILDESGSKKILLKSKEYPGVWFAGKNLGDEYADDVDGEKYYGYYKDILRPLSDYGVNIFKAIKILRVVS